MQRIGGYGNINGLFVAESVAQSLPPTAITAEWLNSVQEEIATVVEEAGMALDASSNRQLYEAIAALIAAAAGGGGAPSGSYLWHAGAAAPAGYLACDGSAVSRSAYPALFAAIGTIYGVGDGSTTFNLPDPRGRVLRALDSGKGIDPGRVMGSTQDSAVGTHSHTGTTDSGGTHTHAASVTGSVLVQGFGIAEDGGASRIPVTPGAGNVSVSPAGAHTHTFSTAAAGGPETRMANMAALLCIKI